jgi:soluble lytic murein transglycosylase
MKQVKKNIHINKLFVVFSLIMIALLYQNFDYAYMLLAPHSPVDERSRAMHAKELLGKSYTGSLAQQAESLHDLHISIYQQVYRYVPKKSRHLAGEITQQIIESAQEHSFDPVFLMAVIKTESTFNPKAKGSAGEIGLMQIKPDTAEYIAKKNGIPWHGKTTLESPKMNIRIGAAYLAELQDRFNGRPFKYVSAYNLGATKLLRLVASESAPTTYNDKVLKNYSLFYKKLLATRMTIVVADARFENTAKN